MIEQAGQINHKLEIQLIIEASQTKNHSHLAEKISNILKQNLDWDFVLRIAKKNSLLPLISSNLLRNFGELLPKEIAQELSYNFQAHLQFNMTLTKRLVDVIKLFQSNKIPVISFKGPLLALQAYDNLALRQFNDLDILVQPKDLDKSIDLLIKSGFVPQNDLRWFEKKDWYLSRVKDVVFVDEKSEYILELHWKLSGAHFAYPIEIERLWQNSKTKNLAGIDVNVLSFNDLLIYLCLHGSRHSWERFSWICDLNELILSKERIDWNQISEDAKRLGCENILSLGLLLINKYFKTKVPLQNWDKIEQDGKLQEIVKEIELRLFEENVGNMDIGDRYAYHLKLKERRWDRFKLHLHYQLWYLQLLILPNSADKETFNLPAWSNPVYYLIRPMRLFYTYIIKSKKN